MKTETKRALVIPDLQVPYHDDRSLQAVLNYAADNRWDDVIILGDLLDFDFISSFSEKALRQLEGKTFLKHYLEGRVVLDRILAVARKRNKKCRAYLIEGNHEYRVERYLDKIPAVEGFLEVPTGLDLTAKRVKWIPFWQTGELLTIGKANFIHGKYTSKYHAFKHVDHYGCHIFYGHVHDVQSYSKPLYGKDKTHIGQSLGCLCLPQQYMRGGPDNWQQAFAVFYFDRKGYFSYYVPRIVNHSFTAPDGKAYAA